MSNNKTMLGNCSVQFSIIIECSEISSDNITYK